MEFVGDDGEIFASQIVSQIQQLLPSNETDSSSSASSSASSSSSASTLFTAENSLLRRDLLTGIAVGSEHSEEVQDAFGQEVVFRFIVAHFQEDIDFVKHALTAWMRLCRRQTLSKATVNTQNCDLSTAHLQPLVDVMKQYAANTEITFLTTSLVMMLASDSTERQQSFGQLGVPAVIGDVLKIHRNNAAVVEMACRDIRNLSADDDVASLLVQEGVGEQLHAILQDREQQPIEVIEAVIFAVINLSYDNQIALILGALGLCVSIVDVLPSVIDNDSLCDNICWALRNLSTVPQNLQILKFTNVCELLLEVLHLHGNNADVMQSAMWCIANLCCSSYLAHYVLAAGVIEVMINAYYNGLKVYPDDITLGPIAEASIFAIFNMSTSVAPNEPPEEVVKSRSSAAGEKDTEGGLQPEGNDGDALEGPETQDFKAECVAVKEKIGNAGACWLLAEYLGRYGKREAMAEAISRAIGHLAEDCTANKALLSQFHVVKLLCDSVKFHVEAADTLYIIWKCLLTVLKKDEGEDEGTYQMLLEEFHVYNGIQKNIVDLIRKHKEYEEILTYGCQLLLRSQVYSEERLQEMIAQGHLAKNGEDDYTILIKDERFADFARAWELDRISPADIEEEAAATEAEASSTLPETA